LPKRGAFQSRAVGKDNNRESLVAQSSDLGLTPRLVITCKLDPAEWDIAAMEKVAYSVGRGGTTLSEKLNLRIGFTHEDPNSHD
jgi:hypothetical protein